MWQRLLATAVVILLVIGGGYYAYRALLPEDAQAGGPVYATAPVIRDDLSVTIEGFGKLNPHILQQHPDGNGGISGESDHPAGRHRRRLKGAGRGRVHPVPVLPRQ